MRSNLLTTSLQANKEPRHLSRQCAAGLQAIANVAANIRVRGCMAPAAQRPAACYAGSTPGISPTCMLCQPTPARDSHPAWQHNIQLLVLPLVRPATTTSALPAESSTFLRTHWTGRWAPAALMAPQQLRG